MEENCLQLALGGDATPRESGVVLRRDDDETLVELRGVGRGA